MVETASYGTGNHFKWVLYIYLSAALQASQAAQGHYRSCYMLRIERGDICVTHDLSILNAADSLTGWMSVSWRY